MPFFFILMHGNISTIETIRARTNEDRQDVRRIRKKRVICASRVRKGIVIFFKMMLKLKDKRLKHFNNGLN